MPQLELKAGNIDFEDRGSGPPIVLLHGMLMSSTLWREVIPVLEVDHRVIAPTLPLGSHREPMRRDADLSLRGQVAVLEELFDRLQLRDAAVLGTDTGGGLALLLAQRRPDLVGRLILAAAEAFDNYPPGLPGKVAWLAAQAPPTFYMALQPMRLGAFRRLPITFGRMTKRPVPNEVARAWLEPALRSSEIRRDCRKYAKGAGRDRHLIEEASAALAHFKGPVLIVWSIEDKVFPIEHARRLAQIAPNATLREISDSYALISEDRPDALNEAVRQFLGETGLDTPASVR
jgi:pimeloyl-ACP methyl ester carboxylesterase